MVKRGGPSARHGIHNTNGWNILKVGTLSIVLHVDTFPFQMLLKLLLHHMKGTQTGRRQCIKMEVLRGMRNLKVIRMPCMLGVNIRKTFWQIHLCVMLWTRHIKKKVEENRIYIKTVAEVVLLTAMQNLSQRGHLETDTSQNKGNFLELMELLSKHNPLIAKKWKLQEMQNIPVTPFRMK